MWCAPTACSFTSRPRICRASWARWCAARSATSWATSTLRPTPRPSTTGAIEGFLWKTDFARVFLESYPELRLVKQRLYPYINDAEQGNQDVMFLLEKGAGLMHESRNHLAGAHGQQPAAGQGAAAGRRPPPARLPRRAPGPKRPARVPGHHHRARRRRPGRLRRRARPPLPPRLRNRRAGPLLRNGGEVRPRCHRARHLRLPAGGRPADWARPWPATGPTPTRWNSAPTPSSAAFRAGWTSRFSRGKCWPRPTSSATAPFEREHVTPYFKAGPRRRPLPQRGRGVARRRFQPLPHHARHAGGLRGAAPPHRSPPRRPAWPCPSCWPCSPPTPKSWP